MVDFRLLHEGDFQQAVDLADKVFRKEGHVSMGVGFPQVFSSALHQSYGAFIEEKLVSFIGLVPSVLHIEGAEIHAYSIGAVCTEPDYRKRGFANTLLQMIFEHINKSGASVLFVSGNLPIYLKQGCTFYGKMNQYKIRQGDIQVNKPYTVRELQPYDWFHMRKLGHGRPVRYEQSIYEIAQLNEAAGFASISKMNHKVLIAEENQKVKAFLVFGIPYYNQENVESRVVEWGGNPEAIKSLLQQGFTYGLNKLIFNVPTYESALNEQLDSLDSVEQAYPGTMKIMNLALLLEQLGPYLNGKVDIVTIDENHKKLSFKQKSVVLRNQEIEELIVKGNQNRDSNLQSIFPIPFPYPQGLNYV